MTAKLNEIFEDFAKKFGDLSKSISEDVSSYEFESSFKALIHGFGQSVFQAIVEKPKSKNDRITILTSMGPICFPKGHPLATAPGGFKISPFMQEHLCRSGTMLTFEEASEQVTELMGVEVNAKQIERLCHHYGELLEQVDWKQAYNEATQLRLPLKDEATYAMIDGSMILTRQKDESWKEVKLCRTFQSGDRAESVSKGRNCIGNSNYVAHLGKHGEFFDKVIEVLPTQSPLVFICDGAKWIWKWVEEYYPNSTQILDLYHCKEHLYAFAKIYFAKDEPQSRQWVGFCTGLLMDKKVGKLLATISELPCWKQKQVEKEKQKLYNYLKNNKSRINYGLFKEQGLLFGSGAIESANRDVIQKRMKLSGQRWTLSGAQQMLNLRVCYKSKQSRKLHMLITDYQKVA